MKVTSLQNKKWHILLHLCYVIVEYILVKIQSFYFNLKCTFVHKLCLDKMKKSVAPLTPSLSTILLLLFFSCQVLSGFNWLHDLQHARLLCLSLSFWVCSSSCPLSQWRHSVISSSVTLFSSCPQSSPASGYFPMIWLLALGGQSIGASISASVLPIYIWDWFPLGLTCLISLESRDFSKVFSKGNPLAPLVGMQIDTATMEDGMESPLKT